MSRSLAATLKIHLVVSSRQQALGSPSVSKRFGLVEINVNFEALA